MALTSAEAIDNYIDENIVCDDDYKCPVCFELLDVPLQLNCGHRICDQCIDLLNKCPLCNATITAKFTDIAFGRKITGIDIKCPQCIDVVSISQLHKHIAICRNVPEKCKYGCTIKLNRNNIKDHYKECPNEEVECIYCDYGCDYVCNRKEMISHMMANIQHHFMISCGDKTNPETQTAASCCYSLANTILIISYVIIFGSIFITIKL